MRFVLFCVPEPSETLSSDIPQRLSNRLYCHRKIMNSDAPLLSTQSPPLWNPNAAANWSLLLTPAFGAFLQARNAEALGRQDEAKSNWRWCYGTWIYFAVTLFDIFTPEAVQGLSRLLGIVIILTCYFKLGRKQARFVKKTFGKNYPRRSWGIPLLAATACIVGLIIITTVVGLVGTYIFGRPIVI